MNGKIKFSIYLCCSLLFNVLKAQDNKKVVKASYDLEINTELYKSVYKSVLYFDDAKSKFETVFDFDGETSKEIIYYNHLSNQFNIKIEEYPKYNVTDSITLNWTFENQTKLIKNFVCKKATLNFRGRVYTAWYCPEVPCKSGPYKFVGLPGLIFEISDSKNISFKLTAINTILDFQFDYQTTFLNAKHIKLKDFELYKTQKLNDDISRHSATLPRNTKHRVTVIKDTFIEKTFEWEE